MARKYLSSKMLLCSVSIGAVLSCSGGAWAQTAASGGARSNSVDEVVVTARLREESLIKAPIAVTALSAADVNRYASVSLNQITQGVPQVMVMQGPSGTGASYIIRGVGSSTSDSSLSQSVALNLDGVQIARARIVTMSMFDVKQVEILKGPQALFFGKNSPAGVIAITSQGPTDTLEAYLHGGYEFEARERFIEGAVSGPLSDKLKARLAMRASQLDGWLVNKAEPQSFTAAPQFTLPGAGATTRLVGGKDVSARLSLQWEPVENLTAKLRLAGGWRKDNALAAIEPICAPTLSPQQPSTSGRFDPTGDCRSNGVTSMTEIPTAFLANWPGGRQHHYAELKFGLATLNVDYKLGPLNFTSITSATKLDYDNFYDNTYTSVSNIWSRQPEDTTTYSQEFRVSTDFSGPLNFSAGAFYENLDRSGLVDVMLAYAGPDPVTGRYFSSERINHAKGQTYSAFAQLRWKPVESVEVAAGARYTEESKSWYVYNEYIHSALVGLFRPVNSPLSNSLKESNLSPDVTVSWHPTESMTVYGAYKTGYKSGGFSDPPILTRTFNLTNTHYRSEKAEGFEGGVKGEFLDHTLRADLVAYTYKYSDLQVTAFDAPTLTLVNFNAAASRSQGIEGSINWRVTSALTLRSGVAYNRTRFLSYPTAPCYLGQTAASGCVGGKTDQAGKPPARAPDWSLNGGASYEGAAFGSWRYNLSGDASYTSRYFTQENENPFAVQKAFWLANAAIRVFSENSPLEFSLIGRNLANKHYVQYTQDKANGRAGEFGSITPRGREIMLDVKWRLN